MIWLLILEKDSGSGKRVVESYNGEAINAPRLSVQIQWDASNAGSSSTLYTVRDRLKDMVTELEYKSGVLQWLIPCMRQRVTGAVKVLLYGKVRGNQGSRSEYTRVSHPLSYTGGSVSRDPGCTDENLNSIACIN